MPRLSAVLLPTALLLAAVAASGCNVLNLNGPCGNDSDCGLLESCVAGVCVALDASVVVPTLGCNVPDDCGDVAETCVNSACVALPGCAGGTACPDGTFCWTNDDQCRRTSPACLVSDDCDDGSFCTVDVCNPDTLRCESPGSPCQEPAAACDEEADACFPCVVDADCDDGSFCTGAESCVNHACVPGTYPCTAPGLGSCLEEEDRCVQCLDDETCATGNPCDGDLRCDGFECTEPVNPCGLRACVLEGGGDGGVLDDGGVASADGGTVDRPALTFRCLCISDDQCDDGAYCTGEETCVAGECISAGNPCEAMGENCLEGSNACGACQVSADCADGSFCNGDEMCNAAEGDCVPGQTLQCAGAEPECSEIHFGCVECNEPADCPIIPADHPLWLNKAEGETQAEACFPPICVDGRDCAYTRRCEGGNNPLCGCAPGDNCSNADNWGCGECNVDNQCGGNNGNDVCARWRDCEECENRNSTNSPDPSCNWAAGRPYCWEPILFSNTCAECIFDSHCSDNNLCTIDTCGTFKTCSNTYKCNANQQCNPEVGDCVQCFIDGHCGGGTPHCDLTTNNCVECINDGDCAGALVCENRQCVECRSAAQCVDGDPCTNDICGGNNTCSNPDACPNACIAGTGQCVGCVNASDCGGATPICDNNQCVECTSPADCGDGDLCTNDICNNGSCQNPDACPGEQCVSTTGACVQCLTPADCSDGDPCTDDECNGGSCDNPDACPGEQCVAATGACVECLSPADCSDGDPCTDDECNGGSCANPAKCPQACLTDGTCVECDGDEDCTMPATCDLGSNTCVGG